MITYLIKGRKVKEVEDIFNELDTTVDPNIFLIYVKE